MKVLLLLALCSCGYDDGYIHIAGLNILPGSTTFDTALTTDLVRTVEAAVNTYYPGLDLEPLLEKEKVVVLVQPAAFMSEGGLYMRGNEQIYLREPTSDIQCLTFTYTLGHELLHFADWAYLGLGNGHSTPHLFFMGTTKQHYPDTAEYMIWTHFAGKCGYDPAI